MIANKRLLTRFGSSSILFTHLKTAYNSRGEGILTQCQIEECPELYTDLSFCVGKQVTCQAMTAFSIGVLFANYGEYQRNDPF